MESRGFDLHFAVEKSPQAARTFARNLIDVAFGEEVDWWAHLNRSVPEQAAEKLVVAELSRVLENRELMESARAAELDAVVGGPPCQGFSLAGRRNPADIRNALPWQFLEFVDHTTPKIVVIENVVGMGTSFTVDGPSEFQAIQEALRDPGKRPSGKIIEGAKAYVVQPVLANALHFGAPQNRPRLLAIGIRSDLASQVLQGMPSPTSHDIWRSTFKGDSSPAIPRLAPKPTSHRGLTVSEAVGDLVQAERSTPSDYVVNLNFLYEHLLPAHDGPLPNNTRRKHRPATTERFRLYQVMKRAGVPTGFLRTLKLVDAQLEQQTVHERQRHIFDAAFATSNGPFFDGREKVLAHDKDELFEIVLRNLTSKYSQRALDWKSPARTVVTLPDDYVHPIDPRTFTVREMARFQGFPDNFIFLGPETTGAHRRRVEVPQYTQVGNAVSPWLGRAIGAMLKEVLERITGVPYAPTASPLPSATRVAAAETH